MLTKFVVPSELLETVEVTLLVFIKLFLIEGMPKHAPTTKVAPIIPDKKGTNTVFPKPPLKTLLNFF